MNIFEGLCETMPGLVFSPKGPHIPVCPWFLPLFILLPLFKLEIYFKTLSLSSRTNRSFVCRVCKSWVKMLPVTSLLHHSSGRSFNRGSLQPMWRKKHQNNEKPFFFVLVVTALMWSWCIWCRKRLILRVARGATTFPKQVTKRRLSGLKYELVICF